MRKLKDPAGQMIGLALVGLESDYFGSFYRNLELGHGDPTLTLTRSDGLVLARHPANEALMGKPLLGVAHAGEAVMTRGRLLGHDFRPTPQNASTSSGDSA